MKMFEYTAVNKEGNLVKGRVQADSREDAMIMVKEEALFPTKMQEMNFVDEKPSETSPKQGIIILLVFFGLIVLGGFISGILAVIF